MDRHRRDACHVDRLMALARGLIVAVLLAATSAPAGLDAAPATQEPCGGVSLTADWPVRDLLPQSTLPLGPWYQAPSSSWGPPATTYPAVEAPAGCDPVAWQRARVVAVARRYLGLSYRHHHVPAWDPPAALVGPDAAGPGLDCSNFSAWVYNYGLGVRFTSDVQQQAAGPLAPGRVLAPDEPYASGDLLFILREDRSQVSHVVIYVDDNTVIDSHGAYGGITEHPRTGWYQTHLSHARRIVEGSDPILGWPPDEQDGKLPAG
jgi:cell wall-associated NlpC family hydrolase